MTLKCQLTELARKSGFDLIGFCSPEINDDVKEAYDIWLSNGFAGNMNFMSETKEIRKSPEKLLPGVKTIISVAISYLRDKEIPEHKKGCGIVARYARSRDYHRIFNRKMKDFCSESEKIFRNNGIEGAKIVFSCDTKPVFEKYFAWKSGLGFIGRNSCLITKKYGSFVLLGTFLTTAFIERDEPDKRGCGSCRKCVDLCPTKAIVADRVIDSTKCISYWTIEHDGDFPERAKPLIGSHLFGCDICQDVCPWNKNAMTASHDEFRQRIPANLELNVVLKITTKEEFLGKFAGTPLMRAGFEGMKRNAEAVMGNQ
ncbi:tRNA epoxyqueuosine(34) reductase QueG [Candidatus Woesearchaeota archaeon]|nr:tRNA epoxyqueuosine(34) reductase QueG [Candidatus Woesearchaeota archaeon]